MTCKDIRTEVSKAKKVRKELSNQVISHAVGELIIYNDSLLLNRLMTKEAAKKINTRYPSMGTWESIKNKLTRRLKHLRINAAPQPKKLTDKDLLYDEFFKEDSYKIRRDAILKNNRRNKLEYFSDKYSVFSRDDYVIFSSS